MNPAARTGGWQRPGFLQARGGRLTMDGLDLVGLAEERGTPLLVYSEARLRSVARRMLGAFRQRHAHTTLCFASKACSAPRVLGLLRDEGLALEVNSGGELFKGLTAGFAPEQIVFNGVAKSREELAAALAPPIKAINVDGLDELARLVETAERCGRRANVALRLVPGVESATSAGNRTGSEATKFGLAAHELPEALAILRRAPEQLALVGVHAHIGSQIGDPALFRQSARSVMRLVSELQADLGQAVQHVNLGGGFAIPYVHEAAGAAQASAEQGGLFREEARPEAIADAVVPEIRAALGQQVELLFEPGRSLVGEAAVLLSRVEAGKRRDGRDWLVVDAGYNVLIESLAYKWYYQALTANRLDEAESADFRLVGPLCDSGDAFHDVEGEALLDGLLAREPALEGQRTLLESALVRLPRLRRLAAGTGVGDLVAFLDVGAYAYDQLTANNGRPRPEVGLIAADGGYAPMRRRDSLPDLLANELL